MKLEIHIKRGALRRGSLLRGEVHLLGGKAAKKVRGLHLRLLCEWNTELYGMDPEIGVGPGHVGPYTTGGWIQTQWELEGEKGRDEVAHIELAKNFQIHAGERRTFPFEIELPKGQKEAGVHKEWKLQAQADIPFARDVFAEKEIKLA